MKEEIEKAFKDLIGLQLTKTTRAANMECLKFGQQKIVDAQGELREIGELSIHLQCSWRFVNHETILTGSQDLYEPEDEQTAYDEDFDWQAGNLRDYKLGKLIETSALVVEAVEADGYGGIEVRFSHKIKLQVFPVCSKRDDYTEHWRLLDNRAERLKSIVVSIAGVETVE